MIIVFENAVEMGPKVFSKRQVEVVVDYDNKKNARRKLSFKQCLIQKCAPLSINKSFLDAADWSIKTIDDRSIYLAMKALERWKIT